MTAGDMGLTTLIPGGGILITVYIFQPGNV